LSSKKQTITAKQERLLWFFFHQMMLSSLWKNTKNLLDHGTLRCSGAVTMKLLKRYMTSPTIGEVAPMTEVAQGTTIPGVRLVVMHPKRAVGMNDCIVEVVVVSVRIARLNFLRIHPMAGTGVVVCHHLEDQGTVVVLWARVVTLGFLRQVLVVQVVPHPKWLLSKVVSMVDHLVDIKWATIHQDPVGLLEVRVRMGTGKGFISLRILQGRTVRMAVIRGVGAVSMVRVQGRVPGLRWSLILP
jgi:hypothetical protein